MLGILSRKRNIINLGISEQQLRLVNLELWAQSDQKTRDYGEWGRCDPTTTGTTQATHSQSLHQSQCAVRLAATNINTASPRYVTPASKTEISLHKETSWQWASPRSSCAKTVCWGRPILAPKWKTSGVLSGVKVKLTHTGKQEVF